MGKKKKKERHSESMGSCKTQHRENKGHSIWNSLGEGGQPSPRGNSAGSRETPRSAQREARKPWESESVKEDYPSSSCS